MYLVTESADRTVTTPSARMVGLAGPSQGSAELSTWRVELDAGAESPVHAISREQVWMPVAGVIEFEVDGAVSRAGAGQACIVPAGAVRQFRAVDGGPARAFVAMAADGTASVPGRDAAMPIPWAE